MGSIASEKVNGVLVRPVVNENSGQVHVAWNGTGLVGRAVRVYVDGVLWDVVCDGVVGETWLHLDRVKGHRIELRSVEVTDAFAEDSRVLAEGTEAWTPNFVTEAAVGIVRDENLAVDSVVQVAVDGVNDGGHRLWGGGNERGGFGGLFGEGGFGWDGSLGVGLGLGDFGEYGFGFGGTAWRWRDESLSVGDHTIEVRVEDSTGVEIGVLPGNVPVTIDALPLAANGLMVSDGMVLSWS